MQASEAVLRWGAGGRRPGPGPLRAGGQPQRGAGRRLPGGLGAGDSDAGGEADTHRPAERAA